MLMSPRTWPLRAYKITFWELTRLYFGCFQRRSLKKIFHSQLYILVQYSNVVLLLTIFRHKPQMYKA